MQDYLLLSASFCVLLQVKHTLNAPPCCYVAIMHSFHSCGQSWDVQACVAVPGRNRTLFHCPFRSYYSVRSAVMLYFRYGWGSYLLCINLWILDTFTQSSWPPSPPPDRHTHTHTHTLLTEVLHYSVLKHDNVSEMCHTCLTTCDTVPVSAS